MKHCKPLFARQYRTKVEGYATRFKDKKPEHKWELLFRVSKSSLEKSLNFGQRSEWDQETPFLFHHRTSLREIRWIGHGPEEKLALKVGKLKV